jgi:hypothetical protein
MVERLDDAQLNALVLLVRIVAEIDGFVTLEESDAMEAIAEWPGAERFWPAYEESRQVRVDVSDLEAAADNMGAVEHRETVCVMLEQLADTDGSGEAESAAVRRLRKHWGLG